MMAIMTSDSNNQNFIPKEEKRKKIMLKLLCKEKTLYLSDLNFKRSSLSS